MDHTYFAQFRQVTGQFLSPTKKLSFDLQPSQILFCEEVVTFGAESSTLDTLNSGNVATSTLADYKMYVKKFRKFCTDNDFPYPRFTEKSVILFLSHAVDTKESFS